MGAEGCETGLSVRNRVKLTNRSGLASFRIPGVIQPAG